MPRRLLLAPLVVAPVAYVAWVKGFVWPVAMTAYSLIAGRRPGDNDEMDVMG